MSRARRLAHQFVELASRLMPERHGEWAQAMAAEQAHIEDHRSALAFSAGCLRAAGWERLRGLAPDASWFWPALVTAALLLISGSVPGSRAMPLLWAPVGGLLSVMMLEQMDGKMPFGRVVAIAFKAGLLCGFLFLAGALLLFMQEGEALSERFGHFLLIGTVIAFLTTISGGAVAPLICSPPGAGASQLGRIIDMAIARHPIFTAGIALGILYVFEALFATGILFAAWPILGGVFAAALMKWNSETRLTPGSGAAAGAKAGLIGGAILLIVGTPLTRYLMEKVNQEPKFFGVEFDLAPIPTLMVMFAIYALAGMLVAAAAGAITGLLAGRRSAGRDEPVRR